MTVDRNPQKEAIISDDSSKKPLIQFKDICKSFGENSILHNFNLSIYQGDFLTVIGSSGCGKTTMLKLINGLVKADSGSITIDDSNIDQMDLIELRRNIGYAIQGNVLFPHMTIEENVAYVPNLLNGKNKAKTSAAVKKWLDIVGLDYDMKNRYPSQLSGGQQQRVGIARAFAASPEILLMDEPFGAVDMITRKQLQEEIKRIHEKTKVTIVFVTHDIDEALYLGDKVLIMDKGEIQQYDTPNNIMKHPANEFVTELTAGQHFI